MEIGFEVKEKYGVGQRLLRVSSLEDGPIDAYEIIVEVIGSASDLIDIGVWDESGHGHYARLTIDQARRFARLLDAFVANPVTKL